MDVVQDADIDWQLPNKFSPGDLTGGGICNILHYLVSYVIRIIKW